MFLLACGVGTVGSHQHPSQGPSAVSGSATSPRNAASAPTRPATSHSIHATHKPLHPTPPQAHPTSTAVTPRNTQHYDIELNLHCTSSTGTSTHCTVLIRNNTDSTADFTWTGTSQPPGARFTPTSGTVPRGTTTGPVTVDIPLGNICPAKVQFVTAGGFTATGNATSVNGLAC